MAIKIINGKIWDGTRHIQQGETMIGLTEEDESYLVSIGVAEYEKAQVIISTVKQPETLKISNANVKAAVVVIESTDSVDELKQLLQEETEGKKRSTVISAINKRIEMLEVTEEDPEEIDQEDSEAPLDLNLDPEDMIVS